MRYAADIGSSPSASTPRSYSFAPGAGASFAIVVHQMSANAGCGAYTLTVTSDGPWADARPVITGSPAVGATITGADATWKAPAPAVQRRWRRCDSAGSNCTDIPGATGTAYTVTNETSPAAPFASENATDGDGTSSSESGIVEPLIPFRTKSGAVARRGRSCAERRLRTHQPREPLRRADDGGADGHPPAEHLPLRPIPGGESPQRDRLPGRTHHSGVPRRRVARDLQPGVRAGHGAGGQLRGQLGHHLQPAGDGLGPAVTRRGSGDHREQRTARRGVRGLRRDNRRRRPGPPQRARR